MNNWILRTGFLAAASAFSCAASAAVYYVSDCQSGAASGCVAGNGANAGTSASSPKQTFAQVPALKGGDQVLFAKGGAWTNAGVNNAGGSSTTASPIIFDSYTPSWGGTAKPILSETRADTNGFFVQSGQGMIIRNLELRGGGNASGVFVYSGGNNTTLDSMTITGFNGAFYCAKGPSSPAFITVKNSSLRNSKAMGILSGCDDMLFENNALDNNGQTAIFDHNIYLDNKGLRNVIRGNTLTRSTFINGQCQGVSLVVHGIYDGLTIENNTIIETAAANTCYGIQVAPGYGNQEEGFKNVTIRGNRVINVGGLGIAASSCQTCTIENNVVVQQRTQQFLGIGISDDSRDTYDWTNSNIVVRNNSIYLTNSSGSDSLGVQVYSNGTNHTVVSNLVYLNAGSGSVCFGTGGRTVSGFTAFNSNLCYRASGSGLYSTVYSVLSLAQAAGLDLGGISVNPNLVAAPSASNNWSMALSSTSPAINAGNSTLSSKTDILGGARSTPDIGAFEFGGAVDKTPPSPPSSIAIQ